MAEKFRLGDDGPDGEAHRLLSDATSASPRLEGGDTTNPRRQLSIVVAVALLVGAAMTAVATTASGTTPTLGKPVIGKPVTFPAQPLAGKRFTVFFKVTRRDTGAPLTRGEE